MPPRSTALALAIVAIVMPACAQSTPTPDAAGALPTEPAAASPDGAVSNSGAGVQAAPPEAQGDSPTPVPSPADLPETVEVVEPDFVVDTGADLGDAQIADLTALPGMQHVAQVARAEVELSGPDAEVEQTMMVVDPSDFRPLTPEVTAQAVGVWQRLAAGDVVVRHDVANELGLELGGTVLLVTDEASRVARVGAFAANGIPPVAGVLVPWSLGRELGIERPNGFVLAVDDEAVDATSDAITSVFGSATVERREPPKTQTATATATTGGGSTTLEPFTYTDFGDGTIQIDPAWVNEHIGTVEIPGIATTRCHKLMIPQLLAALDEIQALGLYGHFKPEQFGGCWVARHIDWDPTKPLSNHAWGTAIDFNTHDNWLGETPQMDMRIVEVFEKWGFDWGGYWNRPDGMHFELARIVRPAEG